MPRTASSDAVSALPACDGHSVGVLLTDGHARILIGDRADGAGAAPVAGHHDAHPNPRQAARAQVRNRTGLTVTALDQISGGWRADRCRRGDGPDGPGHAWAVFSAAAAGALRADPGSYRTARWVNRTELSALVDRTLQYARGKLTSAEWSARPGMQPVWVFWLHAAGLVTVPIGDLELVEYVVEHGPRVWSDACAPGGVVCGAPVEGAPDGICGQPVESTPCPVHDPDGSER
jgi:ADP-ribose pyrophosphatase YjhB (NUDIX family)